MITMTERDQQDLDALVLKTINESGQFLTAYRVSTKIERIETLHIKAQNKARVSHEEIVRESVVRLCQQKKITNTAPAGSGDEPLYRKRRASDGLIIPKAGEVYTLKQINTEMYLRDSPHLEFTLNDARFPIQDSHLETSMSEAVPDMADSKWKYIRETHEWIPIFIYVGERPIEEMVEFAGSHHGLCAYPIGTAPKKGEQNG